MTRGFKWLLIALLVPVVVVLLGILLLPLLVDQKKVLAMAADAVRRETGAELTVAGDASFSVYPRLGLQLAQVTLVMPDQPEPLFSARELGLALQLRPLFSGEVAVDGLELTGLELTVRPDTDAAAAQLPEARSDAELEAYYAARRQALEQAREEALRQAAAAGAAPLALNVARLKVADSRVSVVAADGSRILLEIAELVARELNLAGRPIPVELAMRVVPAPQASPVELTLAGRVGVDGESRVVTLQDMQLDALYPDVQPVMLKLDGTFNAIEQLAELALELEHGDLRAQGPITWAAFGSPQLDAQLDVNQLDPVLLLLAGPAAADTDTVPDTDDTLPLTALRDMDTRVRLGVQRATYQGHPLNDIKLALRARDGIVDIDSLTGAVHGGEFDLAARLDASRQVPTLSSKGVVRALDLTSVQEVLELGSAVTGQLDLDWQLESTGITVSGLLQAMAADLELKLSGGKLTGGGTVRYAPQQSPQIDARLNLNRLDPALLALAGPPAAESPAAGSPAAGTPAAGTPAIAAADGDVSASDGELPLDLLRQVDSRARLLLEEAVLGPHVISDVDLIVRAKGGEVKVQRLTGQLHGGALDLKANLDTRKDPARLWSKGTFDAIDLPQALAAVETEPLLSGKASLDWNINSAGNTVDAWKRGLNGPLSLTTADLVLTTMGVQKLLCEAVAQINQETLAAELPEQTPFDQLSAKVQLRDGVAFLEPLSASLPYIRLNGTGQLDLAEQDFSARLAARLSATISELDPACRVNQRLAAIDWPVKCRGNLSGEPGDWCSVDTGKILEAAVRNEAQRAIEKEAGKLFEKLLQR